MTVLDPFYDPADMSVCVEAETHLAALNARCAKDGLYFPLWRDPETTLGELYLGTRLCSRSFRFGSVADNVLGCRFELPNGSLVELGGRVVKNVVGFDLTRFMAGSQGRFGKAKTLVLRLRALSEVRKEFQVEGSFENLEGFRERFLKSPWVHIVDAFDFSMEALSTRLHLAYACGRPEAALFEDSLRQMAEACQLREAELPRHPSSPEAFAELVPISQCLKQASKIQKERGGKLSGYLGQGLILGETGGGAVRTVREEQSDLERALLTKLEAIA